MTAIPRDQHPLTLRERVSRWFASPNAYPLIVFALSRMLFLLLTYGVLALMTPGHEQARLVGINPSDMGNAWNQWDVKWYTGIADFGYAGYFPGRSSAFFPLMPTLTFVVAQPFVPFMGDGAYLLAGMLVSNAAFLGALWVFYALLRREFDNATAQRGLLYLAFFPKALFTFAAYSESIFLVAFIASYYFLRRKNFLWAGIFAGVATFSRLFGAVLVLPFIVELIAYAGRDWRKWVRAASPLLAIPAALAIYSAFLYVTVGDALSFVHAEATFKRHFLEPIQTIVIASGNFLHLPFGSTHSFNRGFDLVIVFAELALIITAMTPWGLRRWRVPLSLSVLSLGVLLLTLSTPLAGFVPDIISSSSRYLLGAIGVYVILARITEGRPRLHEALLITSVSFLVLFTAAFVLGDYVI